MITSNLLPLLYAGNSAAPPLEDGKVTKVHSPSRC